MGGKPRVKLRQYEIDNAALLARLRPFLEREKELQRRTHVYHVDDPPEPGTGDELRRLIAGASISDVSVDARVLAHNLQGTIRNGKSWIRGRLTRRRRFFAKLEKRLREIERELIEEHAAYWCRTPEWAEKHYVTENIWPPLRKALKVASAEAAVDVPQHNAAYVEALRELLGVGLRLVEIADLIMVTDRIADWMTGEGDLPPSDYLRRYIDETALPERDWLGTDIDGYDGRELLRQAIEKTVKRYIVGR